MPKLFLTPLLIAGLLLLSGCSSPTEQADEAQVKSECDEVKETYDSFTKVMSSQSNSSREFRLAGLIKSYYVLENKKCFTSLEIATARASIDFTNSVATR